MANNDVRAFTSNERQRIGRVMAIWAERHPQPDHAVLGLTDGLMMSPRAIADGLAQEDSEISRRFLHLVAIALDDQEDMGLSEFLKFFALEQGRTQ